MSFLREYLSASLQKLHSVELFKNPYDKTYDQAEKLTKLSPHERNTLNIVIDLKKNFFSSMRKEVI